MILSVVAAFQIAATVPAIRIESTTSSETSGAAPAAAPSISRRSVMTIAGNNLRVEELERTGPTTPLNRPGSIMLMRGADRKMFSIDTVKKEYYEIDLSKMQSQISAMLKSMPGMEMKFSDMKASVQDLGDGEAILGHPTRRYRISHGLTMNTVMMTESVTVSMETSGETWFAKDLPVERNAMSADSSMLTQYRDLIPGVDANRFRQELSKLPSLVPLKGVMTTSSYFGPMDITVKITQLVTKVEKKQVPAGIFEIPAGYKKVQMPDMPGAGRQ